MIYDIFSLDGRVIVITGGLGQLGRHFTRAVLECGGRVAIFDVTVSGVRFEEDLEAAHRDGRLGVFGADVTKRSALESALREVTTLWGIPHGLINNAALDTPPNAPAEENGPIESFPESSWDKTMEVNVKGVFQAAQVIGGAMAKEGRGSIVNISSTYGLLSPDQRIYEYRRKEEDVPFYKPVTYSVSKSAILNLTRYLATYWASSGVRVNTASFGGVFNDQDDRFIKNYNDRVPLGRMARAGEYNGPIIFLLSDASSYMTGSNLVVDGGWTAW